MQLFCLLHERCVMIDCGKLLWIYDKDKYKLYELSCIL